MEIIYLDQNKWIELAKVQAGVVRSGAIFDLFEEMVLAVKAGDAIFPLSASHILETSKRNDPISRSHVARTQALLSQGRVYRSRTGRMLVEIGSLIRRLFGAVPFDLPQHWALGANFFQAFEPMDPFVVGDADEVRRTIRIAESLGAADLYIEYMENQDDSIRRIAHSNLAKGVMDLVSRIEGRRARLHGQSVDMRRRAYSVQLFLDNQEKYIRIAANLGYDFRAIREMGDDAVRSLVDRVPTLRVEAELAARLESGAGKISSNDVFDMQAFYTAIPYSSRIIGEKAAISRARQAKLDKIFNVAFSHSLNDLVGVYR